MHEPPTPFLAILFIFFVYTPSCIGVSILFLACKRAKSLRTVFVAAVGGLALHLFSVHLVTLLVEMEEDLSREGGNRNFAREFCIIGLAVLAVPLILRLVYEAVHLPRRDA